MYQRKVQEKISQADEHYYVDELKHQPAHSNTQEYIYFADGCCIKPFQYQLLPELEKDEGNAEQCGEQNRKSQHAGQNKIDGTVFLMA